MYTMCMDDNGQPRLFPCDSGQTVLDAALAKGIPIPFACKGGGCGMCKIKVETGSYILEKSSKAVLPDSEREQRFALACKTYPTGDVTLRVAETG